MPIAFDPASAEFAADPYPVYARLRSESPVHYVESVRWWWITRYRDVTRVLGDRRFGKVQPAVETGAAVHGARPPSVRPAGEGPSGAGAPAGGGPKRDAPASADRVPAEVATAGPGDRSAGAQGFPPPLFRRLTDLPPQMLESDPPAHTRLRSLVSSAFTPAIVDSLRPRVARLAADALARMAEMGEADLVRDFAFPIPVTIIAELLGVPAEDQDRFRDWSNTFVRALDVTQQRLPGVREAGVAATAALMGYLGELVDERRARPRDDLISGLVAAHEREDGLSVGEVVTTCHLLLVAGHETTTGLLSGGALTLLRHGGQLAQVLARPDRWPAAVEELLRYESPVQRFNRFVLEDVEIGGRLLRRGESVSLVFASANRDAEAFADPDRLDLGRAPNRHVAFGGGIHYCLGAPLARLEAQVALPMLMPHVELAGEPAWRPGALIRGLQHLPVRVRGPAAP